MAKNKKSKREEPEGALPKFGGFHALADGLGEIKAKLAAEEAARKEEAAKRKAAGQKPLPPPSAARRPDPIAKRTAESDRDDELSFHRLMAGVTPLDSGKTSRVPVGVANAKTTRLKPDELREKARTEAQNALDQLHHLVDDGVRFEVSDDGKHVEGRRLDVLPNLVRELRRGALPIDGRLDLHGLSAEGARESLLQFLRDKRTRGERCVLVIHGKGDHSPAGAVLRGEISAWLSQGRAREHVAAFATAREEDGGEGAIYVALRR